MNEIYFIGRNKNVVCVHLRFVWFNRGGEEVRGGIFNVGRRGKT
jgi:hypothetical protein